MPFLTQPNFFGVSEFSDREEYAVVILHRFTSMSVPYKILAIKSFFVCFIRFSFTRTVEKLAVV